ncbi:MAG: hypothetical protein H6779_04650 [Candidatus Nomurabacteria bacterium]|nr:hypothetical protein [Candidatus Nomurabacteria bacterium]USN87663.1 MAG: hypothetical protein H6779_04650 [Candidatus Nomurabacteria bacterium]
MSKIDVFSTLVAGEIVFEKQISKELVIQMAQLLNNHLSGSKQNLEVQKAGDQGNYRIVLSYLVPHKRRISLGFFNTTEELPHLSNDQFQDWVNNILSLLRRSLGTDQDRRYADGIPNGVKYWSITDDVTSLT